MYRFITKASPIARQTTTRITRQYSTRSSTTNNVNSKYIVGVLVPTILALGYFTQPTTSIQNASAADHIREDFAEGDALARDAQERLEIVQTKLQKENEEKAIKKDEKAAVEKAEKKDQQGEINAQKKSEQPDVSKKEGDISSAKPKPSGDASKGEGEGEGEGKQEAAFNPDTGEINWDCPCLGGMAHGPCGEEFKEAFSCFVFSETEPKGIDCIKKFENMRSCFKRYPEHYKDELYDDGDEEQSTAATEHIVLETADPAVQQLEQGIEEGKVKPPASKK
ncbi:Mitochondrial intermembrane space import and assembly protein 40 [Candida viswanathii]|uniref:Mitochondrial intermembrane space import and assembly protein 40 n=1 Tax=Candida viswanathii TaxID=5486 RepID=A0A367XS63_9ASCO|nr:Mitochondrial intermembrane space import and assembly protein 40 [Candida viswanathii]